jgi:hypothetical protein
MSEPLRLWTIYRHPSDYPDKYVARLFEVKGTGPRPTESIVIAPDLETLRAQMMEMKLTKMDRMKDDDPVIVEVWI